MKRLVLLCAGLILAVSFVCANGRQAAGGGGSPSTALTGPGDWNYKYPEPVTVNIGRPLSSMMNFFDGETFENNIYTKWIKDTWNIEIRTEFSAQDADYTQRVTLAIASGDLPDVLQLDNRLQLVEIMESGLAEDLTGLFDKWASPLFKEAANTYGGLETLMYTTFVNGRQYANSSTACNGQDSLFWIREDWRLKLGLPEPKTIDDFVKLAKAFVDNDMAGNGLTSGIEISTPIAGIYNGVYKADPFFSEVGAYPRLWVDDPNGKITYGSIAPQAKEGLRMLRDLYADGIIPRDYVTKDHRAAMAAGQIGVVVAPWWIPNADLTLAFNNDPSAVWRPFSWVGTTTGKRYTFEPNINYGWLVVKKGYNHPEMATRMQNLTVEVRCYFDGPTLTSEEEEKWQTIIPENVRDAYAGRQFVNWVSWPSGVQADFNDMIPRLAAMEQANVERFKAGDTSGMTAITKVDVENIVKWENGDRGFAPWYTYARYAGKLFSLIDEDTIDIKKTYYPYSTNTMLSRWANLEAMEALVYNNIIMGTQPLDDFDTFVRDWLAQGGQTIIQEVNQQYGR